MKKTLENQQTKSSEKIFIGTGGTNPGIDVLDIETGISERIFSVPCGNSVYTIDTSGDAKTLVLGTKAGYFYRLSYPDSGKNNDWRADKFIQGSAILSVCLLDDSRAAATDMSGRCLIWQPDSLKKTVKLPTDRHVICSLFKPAGDRLAGISTAGEVLLWDTHTRDIIDIPKAPQTPPVAALVKPLWWKKAGCWVWPGYEGIIILFDYANGRINTLSGHKTHSYGTCICDDKLITTGQKDGLLKVWQAGSDKPSEVFEIPQGIISATSWPDNESWKLLLCRDTGQSEIFTYKQKSLEFSHVIPVRNCRVIAEPDIERIRNKQQQRITAKAEGLCLDIQENISARRYDQLQGLYQSLEEIGFENASLLLQARESQSKDDLVSELKACHKLGKLSNPGMEQMPVMFERYAHLLRKSWLLKETVSAYARLNDLPNSKNRYEQDIRQLLDYLAVIENSEFVIEPDTDLQLLLQAALFMNNPLVGRFVLKTLGTFNIEASVSSAEFIKCYNTLRQKTQLLPPLEAIEKINWLSDSDKLSGDVIILKDDADKVPQGIELCIRFIDSGFETSVKTAVLFNAEKRNSDVTIVQHNQQIAKGLDIIRRSSHASGFIKTVNSGVNLIIRQLITRALAEKKALMWSR
ncbi:MAG: hypothetical protein ABIG61_07745 [Planctomycetota bacterium]